MRHAFACTFLALLPILMPASALAQRPSQTEQALQEYLRQSKMAPITGYIQAETACGTEVCRLFTIAALERDQAMRNLVALVSGFGFAADVRSFRFRTNVNAYTVTEVGMEVPAVDRRLTMKEVNARAEVCSTLLRYIGALTPPQRQKFNPFAAEPTDAVYFFFSLDWKQGGATGDIVLASPPLAPKPSIDSPDPCLTLKLADGPEIDGRAFPGWKGWRVTWTSTCVAK